MELTAINYDSVYESVKNIQIWELKAKLCIHNEVQLLLAC